MYQKPGVFPNTGFAYLLNCKPYMRNLWILWGTSPPTNNRDSSMERVRLRRATTIRILVNAFELNLKYSSELDSDRILHTGNRH